MKPERPPLKPIELKPVNVPWPDSKHNDPTGADSVSPTLLLDGMSIQLKDGPEGMAFAKALIQHSGN